METKIRRMFLIHDLLPWEDEVPGRTASDLVADVRQAGFFCTKDTVARDLRELSRYARIESEVDGRRIRYKRYHEACLTEFLVGMRDAAPSSSTDQRAARSAPRSV